MRYDAGHKQATRQRIIRSAGRRLKSDGIDASGVAVLMSDVGLTNGAFYAHFDSKDDLVANVLTDQLNQQAAHFDELLAQDGGLERLLEEYLSPQMRDDRASGCPSAALLDEVARTSPAGRGAYTAGATTIIDHLADYLSARSGSPDPARSRVKAISLFGMLVGTMQLARAVDDPALSDEVLASALAEARALVL